LTVLGASIKHISVPRGSDWWMEGSIGQEIRIVILKLPFIEEALATFWSL